MENLALAANPATNTSVTQQTQLQNLLDFDRPALTAWFRARGEKPFRAQQVLKWLHQQGVDDFDAMTNQCGEAGDKIQWLEDHMRGAIPTALATLAGQAFPVRRLQSALAATPACRLNPATLPTPSSNGSSLAGSVCKVNTLRPTCGPTAMRYVIE